MTKEEILKLIGKDATPEDMAAKIAEASAAELRGFIPKSRFDEVNTEKKALEVTVKERDATLATLQSSSGDAAALQQQIAKLQGDLTAQTDAHTAELLAVKKSAAADSALTAARAKNLKAAKALLADFLDGAELDTDGSIKGLADELKKLADGEDTSFLFDAAPALQTTIAGAAPANTPTAPPDVKRSDYEGRYADAQKAGNLAAAIQAKREAAAENIYIN